MVEREVETSIVRAAALRARMADMAEQLARQAEQFSSHLEQAAARGDARRRLSVAAQERAFARAERRNALKMRRPYGQPMDLEPLPRVDAFGSDDRSASEQPAD